MFLWLRGLLGPRQPFTDSLVHLHTVHVVTSVAFEVSHVARAENIECIPFRRRSGRGQFVEREPILLSSAFLSFQRKPCSFLEYEKPGQPPGSPWQ